MKRFLTLLLALCLSSTTLVAQQSETTKKNVVDSVLYTTTLYFEKNQGEWIEKYEYENIEELSKWAKANGSALIDIKGWADPSGPKKFNAELSAKRANTVRKYLVNKGIDSNRISVEGKGIDFKSNRVKARRTDVVAYTQVPTKEVFENAISAEPIEDIDTEMQVEPEVIEEPKVEDAVSAEPIEDIDTEMQVEPEVATATPKQQTKLYIGVGAGPSFGRSTFSSFAADGTMVGINTNLFVGAEFSSLLAAEVNFGYSAMEVGAQNCNKDLYYVKGLESSTPITGEKSFPYSDLTSKTKLYSASARLLVNLMSLIDKESRWQALVIPSVGVAYSRAKVKYNNCLINNEANTQLIVGGAIGAGYSISKNWGVRLTSGVYRLNGATIDALPNTNPQGDIWDTTASVIYKF